MKRISRIEYNERLKELMNAKTELKKQFIESWTEELSERGIITGVKVVVNKGKADEKVGIFHCVGDVGYDNIEPIISKITKSGKPHASQRVCFWGDCTLDLAE